MESLITYRSKNAHFIGTNLVRRPPFKFLSTFQVSSRPMKFGSPEKADNPDDQEVKRVKLFPAKPMVETDSPSPSPYHRKEKCLCKDCYFTLLDTLGFCMVILTIALLGTAMFVEYYDGFRNCRKVGRFRSTFNQQILSALNEYRTCAFLNSTLVCRNRGSS
jgi:hypothetical protein